MPINLGDALLKLGVDKSEFDRSMKQTEAHVRTSMENIQKGLRIAGAAFTAFGAAGLKVVDSARKTNAQIGQTALTIGVTTKEMRDMVLATANVTFGLDSVVKTFDILARAGVRNKEAMVDSANAFDAFADATGASAEVVAEQLIPAFKVFGLELPKTSEEMDRFTWLTKNTTVEIIDFASAMDYVAAYGQDLNLQLDEMVAIMAALEAKGITGSAVTRVFRTAITQAASGAVSLNEALGLTQEEIDGFRTQMQGAVGITDQYAAVANEQFGIMAKLKVEFDKIILTVGSFLTPLEPMLAAMTALGPVMLFLSTQMGINTVKLVAHIAAMIAFHPVATAKLVMVKALAVANIAWAGAIAAAKAAIIAASAALRAHAVAAGIVGVAIAAATGIIYYFTKETEKMVAAVQADTEATVELAKARMRERFEDEAWIDTIRTLTDEQKKNIAVEIERIGLTGEMTNELKRLLMTQDEVVDQLSDLNAAEERALAIMAEANEEIRNQEIASFYAANEKRGLAEVARMLGITEEELEVAIEEGNKALKDQADAALGTSDAFKNLNDSINDAAEELRDFNSEHAEFITGVSEQDKAMIQLLRREKMGRALTEEEQVIIGGMSEEEKQRMWDIYKKAYELAAAALYAGQLTTTPTNYQHGGLIPEPTLLYGLRSMRPYAVAGEAGVEHVVPGRPEQGGAYKTANITIMLDRRILAQELGIPLVDLIRLKTGARI